MNYKVITNEEKLKEFIDWLPDLLPHETFYLALFSRNKYRIDKTHSVGDKEAIKRVTSTKERIIQKFRQMECGFGSYESRGKPIPQECLVAYMTPNPRSLELAAKNTLIKLANVVTQPYNGYNPNSLALTCIHQSKSRTVFVDFDCDDQTLEDSIPKIKDIINLNAVTGLITRGGFHLLVKPNLVEEEFRKTWYNGIMWALNVDVKGDDVVPVPGTFQGGFEPVLVKDVSIYA